MAATLDLIAVDIGASGGRVLCGAFDGQRIALSELHRFGNEPITLDGTLYWDALQLWQSVLHGVQRYAHARGSAPAGIGVDTWGVDFGLLDRAGRLLANPVAYRDARTRGAFEAVLARLGREAIFARTGIQFMPINTIYQLASMVISDDPWLPAAQHLLLMPDLLHYWLTGRIAAERTNASTTQLLDVHRGVWADDLIDALAIPRRLFPELITAGSVVAPLRAALAAHLGLRAGVPVIATGTHDTANAVVAVPGLDGHSAFISSGTWSLIGVETHQPIVDAAALALNVTNEGGVAGTTRLLKNVMGLWLLQECRRHWQRAGADHRWEDILAAAAAAPAFASLVDPDAPEFLAPADMPAALRAFCARTGQPLPDGVGALARCCLESLALKYCVVLDGLERLTGRSIRVLRIVGGGSQNALLNQFTANAAARPVVAGPVEATALGNVVMQAIALGAIPDVAAGRSILGDSLPLATYEPRDRDAWLAARARFAALAGG
jgi:rhamnulokinase